MSDAMIRSHRGIGFPAAGTEAPHLRSRLVSRDDLVERLITSGDRPVVTIAAPAGYGKTTTLAIWDQADPRPFAWVWLEPADDDPLRLARHIAAGLDRVVPTSGDELLGLSGVGRSVTDDLLPCLVHLLADRSPCVLVLDNVQCLGSIDSMTLLEGLLDGLLPATQVVFAGRALPTLALARRHLDDQVLSLTWSDLAMSASEAAGLLDAPADATNEEIADLVSLAEGWPAGIQLLALAVADSDQSSPSPATGREQLIFDYFTEEILAPLPDEYVTFLERASVLEVLTGPVLDELLEMDSAAMILRDLEESTSSFVVPVDCEHRSYRFHPLFAQTLRARLEQFDPGRATALHHRASAIVERQGDLDGAVRHAIAADDIERAADLALVGATPLVFAGCVEPLGQWLDLLGEDAMRRWPSAAIAWAWYGLALADDELIRRATIAAEQTGFDGPLADGSPSVVAAAAMVKAMTGADGVPGVLRDAEVRAPAAGRSRIPGGHSPRSCRELPIQCSATTIWPVNASSRPSRPPMHPPSSRARSLTWPCSTYGSAGSATRRTMPTGHWPSPTAIISKPSFRRCPSSRSAHSWPRARVDLTSPANWRSSRPR